MQQTQTNATCISEMDAERLSVLHRFVSRPVEAQHLLQLEEKIQRADVLPPEEMPADVVAMNSQVLLCDLDTGQRAIYTLVFPARTDARRKCISVLGSLGIAILGARLGDVVEYQSSTGPRRCRIERVIPEA